MDNVANAPRDLRDRTADFARDVLRFSRNIPLSHLSKPIISQLVRASSSIGANFIEAKNASSKRDFRNKVFISKKEASETLYWLKLCEEFTRAEEIFRLQDECQQIILILQRIVSPLPH